MIGMAISSDGITWTKYDDPATADSPYAESDPVLQTGFGDWRMETLRGASVRQTADGWEMFYSEKGWTSGQTVNAYRIGLATSDDGIHWAKYEAFPILRSEDDPAEPESEHSNMVICSIVVTDSTEFLYYDYHWSMGGGIGVATGTVTQE